jgi:hypothetical protein
MEAFTSVGDKLYDDVRRRLNGSILFYEDQPVVALYASGTQVYIYQLERYYQDRIVQGEHTRVQYTDPLLVDKVPTLGYINKSTGPCVIVSRMTSRTQRAGLPTEQLIFEGGSSQDVYTAGFRDMLLNKYPSMQDAYNSAKLNTCVAFSKSYAIDKQRNIFHRGRIIGTLVPSDKYYMGYDIRYHHTISRVSFYRKNFGDRYERDMQRFEV